MMRLQTLALAALAAALASAQPLPVQWEELTAPDFRQAIARAQGACVLPFGIVEKHGPHLPLATDLLDVRHVALQAAREEYAVVFPQYYFGQIFEARHEPGTIAYSASIQLQLLQETADEMARNGCKKILILNGHGGNNALLNYFGQIQLARPHDYVVYSYAPGVENAKGRPAKKSSYDGHAGEDETSSIMVVRPDLVRKENLKGPSGDLQRLKNLPEGVYTGIWWFARFPNHYDGDGAAGNRELGEFDLKTATSMVVQVLRAIKADTTALKLQNEFYEKAKHPLETEQ